MCDLCEAEKQDPAFLNGTKNRIVRRELVKIFSNKRAVVKLCYIHDIELHIKGELKFLQEHREFAKFIASNPGRFAR